METQLPFVIPGFQEGSAEPQILPGNVFDKAYVVE
jgi:hypothetical protein